MKWQKHVFFLSSWVSLCSSGCPDLTVSARLPWSSQRSTETKGVCRYAWWSGVTETHVTVCVPDYIVTIRSSALLSLPSHNRNWLVCSLTAFLLSNPNKKRMSPREYSSVSEYLVINHNHYWKMKTCSWNSFYNTDNETCNSVLNYILIWSCSC